MLSVVIKKYIIFASVLFLLFVSLSSGQYLETVIQVGSYPNAFAYNPTNYKVYCANMGSNSVTVINGLDNSVIMTIRVGSEPCALVYNSTNNKIYCANQKSNDVSIIDGTTNEVIYTIPVGTRPSALVYNSINNKIYCANANSNNVSVIDGVSNNVITTINVGLYPKTLLYNPTNNKIYCANMDSENITVIDGLTNSVITTIPVGRTPVSMCYNPTNNKIYCASWSNGRIHIINGATDQLIDSIIYDNSGPQSLIYHDYSNQIFYSNFTGDNIKVIDGNSDTIIGTIQFSVGTRPYVIASPHHYIYCANIGNNTITVILTPGLYVIRTINMNYPIAIIGGTGTRVCIANLWSSTVSVIRETYPSIEDCSFIPLLLKDKLLVFPNPAKTFFIIRQTQIPHNTSLKIFDISGKMIKEVMLTKPETKILVNDVNPGIYFIQSNTCIRKIVITK